MSHFNGKIVIKKVVNGEPHTIERTFDNQQDYEQFITDNNLNLNRGRDYSPSLSYLSPRDDMMDRYMRPLQFVNPSHHSLSHQSNPILDKYAHKQQELRTKKIKNKQEVEDIQKTIKRLEEMKKDFEADGDQATVQEIESDLKTLHHKLKTLA